MNKMSTTRNLRRDESDFSKLDELHEWLGELSLSKTPKNLPRDFSDAVLMAEVLRFFYPRIVEPHNYIPANSVQMKTENWNTLNRRVMTKLDMKLNKETIRCLASSQPGTIEKVLIEFREKLGGSLMSPKYQEVELARSTMDIEDELTAQLTAENSNPPGAPEVKNPVDLYENTESTEASRSGLGWLLSGFGMGSWLFGSKIPKPLESQAPLLQEGETIESTSNNEPPFGGNMSIAENADNDLRQAYERQLRELRMKNETINALHHKVAFLEGTLKLKEVKISNLQSEMSFDGPDPNAGKLHTFVRPTSQKSQKRRT